MGAALLLLNLFCVWFSWRQADKFTKWSGPWTFNVFASALNAAIVIWILAK